MRDEVEGSEYNWIGRVLGRRRAHIETAEKNWETYSAEKHEKGLHNLINAVSKNPEQVTKELKERYCFLDGQPKSIEEYYREVYVPEAAKKLNLERPVVDYLQETTWEIQAGNPHMLFNPAENHVLLTDRRARLSDYLREVIEKNFPENKAHEIIGAMELAMEAEKILHEMEHALTAGLISYYGNMAGQGENGKSTSQDCPKYGRV